ncbi:MAG: hypothetical protein IPP88_24525 [Betaproteobacteria bacterium]|jgi:hypothetical protein|nr:hypothetical protein [Betaproteobacteria bacterium]
MFEIAHPTGLRGNAVTQVYAKNISAGTPQAVDSAKTILRAPKKRMEKMYFVLPCGADEIGANRP